MEPSGEGINVRERALWWKYSRKSLSLPSGPLTRWRGAGRCERWSVPSAGWISTSDGREEKRDAPRRGLSFSLLSLSPSLPSYISLHPLWSLLSAPHSAASVEGGVGWGLKNENKWGAGKAVGQRAGFCVHVCVSAHACTCFLLECVQISSSAAVSSCGAKRPSRDSSSTCCWAPQGMDWALQAGILSIQPLQAAWETGDGATDSLCLLVYCWASVLVVVVVMVVGGSWFDWSLCQPDPYPYLLKVSLKVSHFMLFVSLFHHQFAVPSPLASRLPFSQISS